MNKEKIITIASWIIFLAIAVTIVYFSSAKNQNGNVNATSTATSTAVSKYDDFAKCLATKDATMYGAVWCSHCQAQKALFGASFQYIKYVECPDNINVCLEKGIKGYPTWIFTDGKKVEGETSLADLAKASGCELPK